MCQYSSTDIFKPASFPEHTYVSRKSHDLPFSYEERLKIALNTPGYLTSIVGPSKIGKTVLCEKVIGFENTKFLTGSDFSDQEDIWIPIAKKVGLSIENEHTELRQIEATDSSELSNLRSVSNRGTFLTGKDKVIEYFKENDLVLVLDDFHYAPQSVQYKIAYQLKEAIRKDFKAIIISLPHRADDAIRKNPDLSGRLNLINIEPWDTNELKNIAITGFEKLHVKVSDEIISEIAQESLHSPQLMQDICLRFAYVYDLDNHKPLEMVTDQSKLKEAYLVTTVNLQYHEVVKRLEQGPPTRGQKRKTYKLENGEKVDVYGLFFLAMALDPPKISVALDELKERYDLLLKNNNASLPDRNKIRSTVQHLQLIIDEMSETIYQVFEWKDNKVYVLEPLFLFFLRWGKY